mmetsp:Transcript_30174/g.79241  ORF Transcript_30174/g.79241 Transcript_30174/m.79241 type:complete len:385 (+) Transcript_30174:784-1938(+)
MGVDHHKWDRRAVGVCAGEVGGQPRILSAQRRRVTPPHHLRVVRNEVHGPYVDRVEEVVRAVLRREREPRRKVGEAVVVPVAGHIRHLRGHGLDPVEEAVPHRPALRAEVVRQVARVHHGVNPLGHDRPRQLGRRQPIVGSHVAQKREGGLPRRRRRRRAEDQGGRAVRLVPPKHPVRLVREHGVRWERAAAGRGQHGACVPPRPPVDREVCNPRGDGPVGGLPGAGRAAPRNAAQRDAGVVGREGGRPHENRGVGPVAPAQVHLPRREVLVPEAGPALIDPRHQPLGAPHRSGPRVEAQPVPDRSPRHKVLVGVEVGGDGVVRGPRGKPRELGRVVVLGVPERIQHRRRVDHRGGGSRGGGPPDSHRPHAHTRAVGGVPCGPP